jgi:hypothetical protein
MHAFYTSTLPSSWGNLSITNTYTHYVVSTAPKLSERDGEDNIHNGCCSFECLSLLFSYIVVLDVYLLITQIYCCTANHIANITFHRERNYVLCAVS